MSFIYKPITHKWDILPDIEANFQSIEKEIGDAGSAKFQGWPVDANGNYVYPNTSGAGGKPYILPLASDKVPGGVIVGAGIVEDATGKISVTPASVGALTKAQADAAYAPITVTQGLTKATADTLYSPKGSITKTDADALYETIADAQLRNEATKQAAITAATADAADKIAQALDDAKTYTDEAVAGIDNTQTPVIGLDRDVADALYADKATAVTKIQADADYAPSRLKSEVVKLTGDQEIDGKKTFKTLPTVKIGSNPETNIATEAFVTAHASSGTGTAYTLPQATDTVLGGVKIKKDGNIEIDSHTGEISVDTSSLTASVAPATTTTLGGIIVGDNLTIDANGKLSATVSNGVDTLSNSYYPNDGIVDGVIAPTLSLSNDRGSDNWFRVGHFLGTKNGSGWEIEVVGAPGIDGGWNETPPVTHNTGNQHTRSIIGAHKNRNNLEFSYYHLGSRTALLEAKVERTLQASTITPPIPGVTGSTILNTLYIKIPSFTSSVGIFIRKLDGARVRNSAKFVADGSLVTTADMNAITTLTPVSQRMSIGTSQAGVSANGVDNNLYLTAGTGGEVIVNNKVLSGLADPVDPTDSVNKRYVDGLIAAGTGGNVSSSGGAARVMRSWEAMKVTKPTVNGELAWLQSYQSGNHAHGCGWFKGVLNVAAGSYKDDGGVTCRGTDFAWERQYSDDNELTIWDFGAWGDGDNANKPESWKSNTELDIGNKVHDDGPAMLAMWNYISNSSRSSVYDDIGVRLPAGSFGVTKVNFGTSSAFRIQGPYCEYGRQPTAYIIALEPNQDEPLLYWKSTSSSISGISFDGRSGILKDKAKGPKGGYIGSDQYSGVRSKKDLWPNPNENDGKAKKRAYTKDLIDPTKGGMTLWGKQPIIEIGHQGAGYLNVKGVTWKRIGGKGITWYDAIDTKFDQVYSSDTYATVINSSWSNYAGGSWDHATAVEICNANFQTGFLEPVLSIPRCAQSLIRNVWLEHSEYPGNLSNGHWMIDVYCQEDCLNCVDVRNSRILIRHLDSIDNVRYNNPSTPQEDDKYGRYASSVFMFGRLSGKNPTEKRNPNDPVVYADGTPVPADKIDVQTLGSADQVKAYNDAVAAGKTGADLDKYLVTNNRNWDLNYGFLSAYEDGMHQIETQYQRSTGSMKYGWLAGQRLPSNPVTDAATAGDYWVFLCSLDNQQISTPEGTGVYGKGHGLVEIDVFTKANATSGAKTDDPTNSGTGGMTRIKIQRYNDKSEVTYYSEGQSGVLDVRSNNWGGPSLYIKLDKACSSAVAFARSSGTTHDNAGSNFLLNWQLSVATEADVNKNAANRGTPRLDFNNGAGKAGIGLSGTHVTMATPLNTTVPTGTPAGTIEIIVNGKTVKIPYYL